MAMKLVWVLVTHFGLSMLGCWCLLTYKDILPEQMDR